MSTTYNNPFPDVPSASGMDRLHNCNASFAMERAHGVDSESDAAASGTRIHAALAGLMPHEDLTDAEQETHDMCAEQAERLASQYQLDDVSEDRIIKEQRLGLTDIGTVLDVTPESRAKFIFTGQADVIVVGDGKAICLDYKTGRSEVPIACNNPQLASLALLVSLRYKVKSVRVAIIAPWSGKPTVADYDENSLALAKSWLLLTLDAARNATQEDLRAGDHCKWCKSAHCCPALRMKTLQEIEVIDPASIAGLDGEAQRKAMWARALDLTPTQHKAAYRGLKMLQRYAEAIEGTFKQRVEAGEIPGFTTKTTPGNREITDAQKAFNAVEPLGVTAEDILACCTIPIGPLQEAVRKRSGIKSKTEKRTLYNLTADEAGKRLEQALTEARVLGRKADKVQVVEVQSLE
jgi:hypothetical protein